MKERIGYIYLLRNSVNGKGYVGQTVIHPEKKRWPEHVYAALVAKNKHPLYKAIRKYGLVNFTAEIIRTYPESKLNAAETRWVKRLNTFIDNGYGYNLTTGGGVRTVCKQTRKKLSSSLLKTYANNPDLRARLSKAQLASYAAEPGRALNIGAKNRANHLADPSKRIAVGKKLRGKKREESTRQQLRTLAIGQWASEEGRTKKIAGLQIGARRRWSDPAESKRRSESQFAKWADPAYKAKMLKARRKRSARERELASARKDAQA